MKLNKTEIKAVAKKILADANEINSKYNESVINSQVYKDEINRLESLKPLNRTTEDFIKELKIRFGTNYSEEIDFSLTTKYGSKARKQIEDVKENIKAYIKSQTKTIYTVPVTEYDERNNQSFQNIVNEIIIAQIDVKDIKTLMNTIIAKL